MSPARRADRELDSLIEEIAVDCYNEDEQLTAFENALHADPSTARLLAAYRRWVGDQG